MEENVQRVNEGFERNQQDHLASKQKDKNRETSMYFKIPQAKPLLPKHFIDYSKPKVLIKQIKILQQHQQLYSGCINSSPHLQQRPLLSKKQDMKNVESNLSNRFIDSNHYKIIYMKYYPSKICDFQRKTNKKLKFEIQKVCKNTQLLFATYVIDINFLFENGAHILRNLQERSLFQPQLSTTTQEKHIQFDSKIECGNLMYVFQRHEQSQSIDQLVYHQYFLILQNDINTKGYGNWFYFKMQVKKVGKIRLHLMNMQKNFSFLGHGMRVAMFSTRNFQKNKIGWYLDGYNFIYQRNQLLKDQSSRMKYNTLSFTFQNIYQNNTIFIASHIPYSYSKLVHHLDQIYKNAKFNSTLYFRKETLASTISSNECPLLTLTCKKDKNLREQRSKKKIIIIMARQHPSEVVSSFVMEGLLNELIYQTNQSTRELLEKYLFKIIPMVNIDGVIYGNSRCDIIGSDINRKWNRSVNPILYPIIHNIQKMINNLIFQGYEIQYFIDLHGHSQKLGSFIYGCKGFDDIETRIFSWIMSKLCNQFSFQSCRFGITNFRKETARGFMLNFMPSKKSMTLQTSLYGYKHFHSIKQFETSQLHKIGKNLLQAIHADTFRNNKLINWAAVRNDIKVAMLKINKNQQLQQNQSDSNPQIDQLSLKEKTNTFISPAYGNEIDQNALTMDKGDKIDNKINVIQQQIEKMFFGLDNDKNKDKQGYYIEKEQTSLTQRYIQSQMLMKAEKANQNTIYLKESKSVTKIIPFKLHVGDKKSNSLGKKIRIALQFDRTQKKEEKMSSQSLPIIMKRDGKSFWNNLKKQCENLINQKKNLVDTFLSGQSKKNVCFKKQTL